ncbi:MAG: adenosylmethionine decarboxylase [Legionellales bacterium]|nr:adenosylmethionine decarboxylase [Legionellales bacterium]
MINVNEAVSVKGFSHHEDTLFAGWHYLLDVYGVDRLSEADWVLDVMCRAARDAGATILHTHMHHFGEGYGVSGVVVLAESHISVHSWPERAYAAFDIFMCGQTNPMRAVEVIRAHCQPRHDKLHQIQRGVFK